MLDRIVVVNSNLIVITYWDRTSVYLKTDNHTAMDLLWLLLGSKTQDEDTCIITSKAS